MIFFSSILVVYNYINLFCHTNSWSLRYKSKKRLELVLIALSDPVINIPLTSYRLLHHSHRKALSLALSSLLHFEVRY